eukprot:4669241-Karenia_brevis.AAC.1
MHRNKSQGGGDIASDSPGLPVSPTEVVNDNRDEEPERRDSGMVDAAVAGQGLDVQGQAAASERGQPGSMQGEGGEI